MSLSLRIIGDVLCVAQEKRQAIPHEPGEKDAHQKAPGRRPANQRTSNRGQDLYDLLAPLAEIRGERQGGDTVESKDLIVRLRRE